MALNSNEIGWLLKMIQQTHAKELSCPECAAQFDIYAQKMLDGEPLVGLLLKVREHLDACSSCKDELHLIVETVRAIDEDE